MKGGYSHPVRRLLVYWLVGRIAGAATFTGRSTTEANLLAELFSASADGIVEGVTGVMGGDAINGS